MAQSKQSFIDYDGFVEKFKPKKTTDDCYTPDEIYEVVRDWACAEYGIDPARIVRPFYPGGDYESFDYSGGAVVLDNPPFSILSKIVGDYLDWGVQFFLFAPSLTCMSSARTCMRCCHVICDADVEYANGAVVRTAFVTSYGGDVVARTAPDLGAAVNAKVEELRRRKAPELPKYEYPDHVVTAAIMQRWAHYGVEYEVRRGDCARISALDAQRDAGKTIFGGGLLLSERAAAERAAAERARAHVWKLSDRERAVVAMLGE